MPVVGIASAKGGCGASIIASNLGVILARHAECLLIDLHAAAGTDDLLLDLQPRHSWADLLPVAGEVSQHHLELTLCVHTSGLRLLASPVMPDLSLPERKVTLLRSLAGRFPWLLIDAPVDDTSSLAECDLLILVSTCDPPALRASQRALTLLAPGLRGRARLVLNQVGRGQPARPGALADGLGVPLLAMLPVDPRAVGYQVHFGQACVDQRRSDLGRGIGHLANRITTVCSGSQVVQETRKPTGAAEAGGT